MTVCGARLVFRPCTIALSKLQTLWTLRSWTFVAALGENADEESVSNAEEKLPKCVAFGGTARIEPFV